MSFTPLVVREQGRLGSKPPVWVLTEPLTYVDPDGREHTATEGMDTDFASVPFFVQWLVPRTGRHNKAAVIHDHLWDEAAEGRFDRSDADRVFRLALAELGVSFIRRWMMWTAVRQGGLVQSPRGRWPFGDILAVVFITVLFVPIVVPASVVVVLARSVLWLLDLLPTLITRRRPPAGDEAA